MSIPLPDRGNCINTSCFQTKTVVSIPLPHRGNYTGNHMRISVWVFYDTVSGQRQLYQYRYQTEAIIEGTLCGSSLILFPDIGSCINTVIRHGGKLYRQTPCGSLVRHRFQTEAKMSLPHRSRSSIKHHM